MKQVSIYLRWQNFANTYEEMKKAIETDPELDAEERLEKVVDLQQKIVSGLDVLEENLEGGN